MKKVAFIADFFNTELLGGGESNDANLISFLKNKYELVCYKSDRVSVEDIFDIDIIIVGNFILLSNKVKNFLIKKKNYIIYEHDHKYVSTRDPSKFINFQIPSENIVNKDFYTNAKCIFVLSSICRDIMSKTIPGANIKNIGCSLWSKERFSLLANLSQRKKLKQNCIMYSKNPTKNFNFTVQFCKNKNIDFDVLQTRNPNDFLTNMSLYSKFIFIPTVLETFSRVCAEAQMMNLKVMTNRTMIGFYSENNSHLSGIELIDSLREKNYIALEMFSNELEEF